MAEPKREMKVLALGLPRTGSMSLAAALTRLGYANVYHASEAMHRDRDWAILDLACDAHFECLPTYSPGHEFGREQWDLVFGASEAATDAASVFAAQLIRAYPGARVVLTRRDFDAWERSVFDGLVPVMWSAAATFHLNFVEYWAGYKGGAAGRKMIKGLFGVADISDARPKAREAYDRHHRVIESMVPPEQLLFYEMGQGWGPLCEFLGKEVPRDAEGNEMEFPRLNEVDNLRALARERMVKNVQLAAWALLPYFVGLIGVAAGLWLMSHQRVPSSETP